MRDYLALPSVLPCANGDKTDVAARRSSSPASPPGESRLADALAGGGGGGDDSWGAGGVGIDAFGRDQWRRGPRGVSVVDGKHAAFAAVRDETGNCADWLYESAHCLVLGCPKSLRFIDIRMEPRVAEVSASVNGHLIVPRKRSTDN